jgi:aldose 1-epimerase
VPNVHNRPEFKEHGDLVVLDKNQTLSGTMTLVPSLLELPDSGLVDDDEVVGIPGNRDYSLVD